ncbi:MAG: energy transducer TonB [Tepidimonas taiwanensis]|nr:energy transducer TonB [Tepidimonas taiwanensis]
MAAIEPPRFDADYLNNPKPTYPPLARRLGEEGKVTLRVLVTPQGQPERIELAESAGSPRLDEAAIEAVRRWRFAPARQGDTAVAAWVRVPIAFRLENNR